MNPSIIPAPDPGIARDGIFPAVRFTASSAIASTRSCNLDARVWREAIDQMLAWINMKSGENCGDYPTQEIAETAIDYAMDQINDEHGADAPDSIVPSGGGRIAMEWNERSSTVIVEFVGLGTATYTKFDSAGKIAERRHLQRNPQSRRLELRG